MKRCAGCGETKPHNQFSPSKRGKGGRAYYCRPCAAAKRREYYRANPHARTRDVERMREYRRSHPEYADRDRASSLQWARDNADVVNARNAGWRKANPERHREIQAAYRARNTEKGAEYVERRRARKLAAPVNDFTAADWQTALEDFGHACAYCLVGGVPLQQEHMTPLSRGGEHTRANIVPACGPCNYRKGTRTLIESLEVLPWQPA